MRDTFPAQQTIGQINIADIKIDVRSRDDIPLILLGLQHIYCTDELREKVFAILKEMLPTKLVNGHAEPVSAELGCPCMDQWTILVLGSLRLCLNADHDRIQLCSVRYYAEYPAAVGSTKEARGLVLHCAFSLTSRVGGGIAPLSNAIDILKSVNGARYAPYKAKYLIFHYQI